MIFVISIAILFLLVFILVSIKFIALILSRNNAEKMFYKLHKCLLMQYDLILQLLSESSKFMHNENAMISETVDLINKSKEFTLKKDGSDRIIAYANTVLHNIDDIIKKSETYIEDKQGFLNVLEKYNSENTKFVNVAEHYNTSAKHLRHYIDVFPTSLIARFINIKTMNSIY